MGSAQSVTSDLELGGMLSARSFARCGERVSLFDFAAFGSSLSVRSLVRLGSGLSVGEADAYFNSDKIMKKGSKLYMEATSASAPGDTYLQYSTTTNDEGLKLYVDSSKTLSAKTVGTGNDAFVQTTMHGIWVSDTALTTSDARLKKDITDLNTTLHVDNMPDAAKAANQTTSSWVLRELRPVSFRLKEGSESKHLRYGFIAQELEKTLPPVVRDTGDRKGVLYQDLIAVLTLTAQAQETRIDDLVLEINALKKRDLEHDLEIARLNKKISEGHAASASSSTSYRDDEE
jgi:hypothetical protein